MRDIEVTFDLKTPSLAAEFEVEVPNVEADFWINVISNSLSNLSDVKIKDPERGQVLVYNKTENKWVNTSLTYIHEQGIASDEWIIEHYLNRFPSVTIVDTAGNVVEGCVQYESSNKCIVRMNGEFKGKAYLN